MSGASGKRCYDIIAETRRVWSLAEKRAIVAEASVAGVNVSAIARRHGMKPSLLFRWKNQMANGSVELAKDANNASPSFVPVALPAPTAPWAGNASNAQPSIEIDLNNGRRIRVSDRVDLILLKRIIDVLEDR
jgi:transposase